MSSSGILLELTNSVDSYPPAGGRQFQPVGWQAILLPATDYQVPKGTFFVCTNENQAPTQKDKSLELLQPYDDSLLKHTPMYDIKKRDAFGNSPESIEEYDYSEDEEFEMV